jgi:hypothetical protein
MSMEEDGGIISKYESPDLSTTALEIISAVI